MTFAKTSICVNYKFVDGWHVFASDDLPGLYVASQDAQKAFADVGPSIQMLLKLDEGLECTVEPELSFCEFLDLAKNDGEPKRQVVLSDKRFAVYAPKIEAVAA